MTVINYSWAEKPLSGKFRLGSARSAIEEIVQEVKGGTGASMFFVSSTGERIHAKLSDFYYRNGELSISGKAAESDHSVLALRGNDDYLEGWLVLRDRDVAYEYTTDPSGNVLVEQVPVTQIIPVCEFAHSEPFAGWKSPTPGPAGPEHHIGTYNGQDVMKLQSLPGAEKLIFLDTREIMNADGTPKNGLDKEDMWQNWQGVASQLSMFQVNVTTDYELYKATPVTNTAIAKYYNQSGRSHSGGSRFGTATHSVVYRLADGYEYGRIAGHEIGHTLGMAHDGSTTQSSDPAYFRGYSEFRWTPLMGNVYPGNGWGANALYHWCKGEYAGANNREDDIEKLLRLFKYRPDDIPASVPLVISGSTVDAQKNRGQINTNQDSDEFTFQVGAGQGHAKLRIDRTEYLGGAMLDVHALIRDESGKTVDEDNTKGSRWADLDIALPPGRYTLVVQGGSEGTPQTGFSKYSSTGFYGIQGQITGGITTPVVAAKGTGGFKISKAGRSLRLDISPGADLESVSLYSTHGKRIYHSPKAVTAIGLDRFSPGFYVLELRLDGTLGTQNIFIP